MESLANSAISLLSQEPNLLELRAPLFLVGDIHGQFYDFLQMINSTSKPAPTQSLPTAPSSS